MEKMFLIKLELLISKNKLFTMLHNNDTVRLNSVRSQQDEIFARDSNNMTNGVAASDIAGGNKTKGTWDTT